MLKTDFILHEFRKPVSAPQWWEGHTIPFKAYPVKGGIGLCTLNLCARDGGNQKRAPYEIGQPVTVSVGGKRMSGQVYRIEMYRPDWDVGFDASKAEWKITLCFPRIPKGHLDYV